MISFFIGLYKLIKIILQGIKTDLEFRSLCISVLLLLFGSSLFYHQFEGWGFIDSLYFSVITMATIGYGDFVPVTNIGKIFTIVYTFLSIGMFVALTTKIVLLLSKKNH